MIEFKQTTLTAEQAFWVMFYFLDKHYDLSGGGWDLSDVLSACQPFEFNELGHFDGKVSGNRKVAPADSAMISFWNEAIEKLLSDGAPPPAELKK